MRRISSINNNFNVSFATPTVENFEYYHGVGRHSSRFEVPIPPSPRGDEQSRRFRTPVGHTRVPPELRFEFENEPLKNEKSRNGSEKVYVRGGGGGGESKQ